MKKLLPVMLALIGTGIGAGAGVFLAPEPEVVDCETPTCPEAEAMAEDSETDDMGEADYLRLQNQFVVPVIRNELVAALVVMSLSLEVEPGQEDTIFSREPKLRDALLRVLFDHAFVGGFDGAFTESSRLVSLRVALLEAAQAVLGDIVTDILITDIVRQEM